MRDRPEQLFNVSDLLYYKEVGTGFIRDNRVPRGENGHVLHASELLEIVQGLILKAMIDDQPHDSGDYQLGQTIPVEPGKKGKQKTQEKQPDLTVKKYLEMSGNCLPLLEPKMVKV